MMGTRRDAANELLDDLLYKLFRILSNKEREIYRIMVSFVNFMFLKPSISGERSLVDTNS